MKNDIDKLNKLYDLIEEINGYKKELKDGHFDSFDLEVSPKSVITLRWKNTGNIDEDTNRTTFGKIDDLIEKNRKNRDYWKDQHEKNMRKTEKDINRESK